MARYLGDQNKILGIHESGAYANTVTGSSFWVGQVFDHSITDNENLIINRYMGTADRNFDSVEQGPIDIEGTISYRPQDMRIVFWTVGSVTLTSGANAYKYDATEIDSDVQQSAFASGTLNPPVSFTIEDSKQAPGTGKNFIRTIKGVVPNVTTITASQNEIVEVTVDYMGQSLTYSSGATTSVTEVTNRPYLWSHVTLTLAGSSLSSVKEASLEINQNRTFPHYLNGSRVVSVPFSSNREYVLSLTMDWDSEDSKMLYEEFYKGGSSFNVVLDLDNDGTTGSQHTIFTMSGCYITSPDVPSPLEGETEVTIEIRPESLSAQEWTESGRDFNLF